MRIAYNIDNELQLLTFAATQCAPIMRWGESPEKALLLKHVAQQSAGRWERLQRSCESDDTISSD